MKVYQKKEMCCGCGACAEICPKDAIDMVQDGEGFYYPETNKAVCIECGKCRMVCPLKDGRNNGYDNLYFGARAIEDRIRYFSSSGGVFSVLAQYVIKRQGVVYGAGYDGNMKVLHQGAEDCDQLEKIKRTKYVQSDIRGIYSSIKKKLKENRWVLFCGTPCQAQALRIFLNREYERLIIVDLVCYGVPSPGMWREYVKYLEKKHSGKMTDFSFRDKRNADNGHSISYRIDGREYVDPIYKDVYCRMYFENYSLRPSCYSCKFCTVNRSSDFTIGDFWGLERIKPEMDDGMGTSLVIVHSEQAKMIWNEMKTEMLWFKCEEKDILQPRLLESTTSARNRRIFMMLYRILPFSIMVKLVDK